MREWSVCGGGGKERRIVTEGTVVPESEMSSFIEYVERIGERSLIVHDSHSH